MDNTRSQLRDKLITSILQKGYDDIRREAEIAVGLPILDMVRVHTFENNVLPMEVGWIQGWADPTRFLSYPLIFKGQVVPQRFLNALQNTKTIQILQQIGRIAHIVTAGFSWMKPGCVLPKHIDNNVGYQVAHLGLIVPVNTCFLYVNNLNKYTQYQEKDGHVIIFSDTNEHYAVNQSKDKNRIILYILYKI
jgi:hypothetical protein